MAASLIRCCRSNVLPSFSRNYLYICLRKDHSLATGHESDNEAEYPPIKPKYPPDSSWGNIPPKIAWLWDKHREEVSAYKSPSEKIEYLTREVYRTWKFPAIQYHPKLLNYQADKTKTLILNEMDLLANLDRGKQVLPDIYNSVNIAEEKEILKPLIIEAIELEHEMNRRILEDKFYNRVGNLSLVQIPSFEWEMSHLAVKNLLFNIIGYLSGRYEHISKCQIDENVDLSACWARDGVQRFSTRIPPKDPNYVQQNNSMFYAEHEVNFQIRKEKPLPLFLNTNDSSHTQLSYEQMNYKPIVLGQFSESMQRKINPGFNLGDPCEFNHLSVILSNHRMLNYVKRKFGQEYYKEARTGYGLSTSFISAVAQAHYQGFNMHEELTYPFTTQTIITDGQEFIFTTYQLNTLLLWKDDGGNNLQNLYWYDKPVRLYEGIENGKVVGFNDNTLDLLLKFLMIAPSDRDGIDLRPNLSTESSPMGKDPYIKNKKIVEVIEEALKFDKS